MDTINILNSGSPEEVKEEFKKRIDDFAPGGGFIFSTVYNVQADVPPENFMAMWETWNEHGKY
ncbi:MAG: uroporphyrinogen decarboxylase family protein [Halanaerobiales bacterium]